mmetsp:Transcript_19206/g.39177  ORF Transcript_19206/g.39177 Transcript_19206/m.39177 type:complete len:233 (-) Transcript_19206:30-728(-)
MVSHHKQVRLKVATRLQPPRPPSLSTAEGTQEGVIVQTRGPNFLLGTQKRRATVAREWCAVGRRGENITKRLSASEGTGCECYMTSSGRLQKHQSWRIRTEFSRAPSLSSRSSSSKTRTCLRGRQCSREPNVRRHLQGTRRETQHPPTRETRGKALLRAARSARASAARQRDSFARAGWLCAVLCCTMDKESQTLFSADEHLHCACAVVMAPALRKHLSWSLLGCRVCFLVL